MLGESLTVIMIGLASCEPCRRQAGTLFLSFLDIIELTSNAALVRHVLDRKTMSCDGSNTCNQVTQTSSLSAVGTNVSNSSSRILSSY
jgi:hypothetical protein